MRLSQALAVGLAVGFLLGVVASVIVNGVAYTRIQELRRFSEPVTEPPISKSQAIDIALEYGGWNETTLESMEVEATLDYIMFQNTSIVWKGSEGILTGGIHVLHQVSGQVLSYKTMRIGDAIFRYVWTVIVSEQGPTKSIPPPGYYYVDAVTGEVTSYDDLILGIHVEPRIGCGSRMVEIEDRTADP